MTLERYTTVAIVLHWVMAVSFILMLTSGLVLEYAELPKSLKFDMYQWHKSLGLLLLATFVARLAWRVAHKPPALPAIIHGWERLAAHAGHWLLYAFMLAVPLSGWLMVSSNSFGMPTIIFGWFEWPHIPNLAGNEAVNGTARTAHWIFSWAFGAAIIGHIAAVVKHTVVDKQNLLSRMTWKKGESR